MFYGNDIGLSRTVYEINDDFSRKSQFFLTSVYFAPKLIYGVHLELGIGAWSKILEWWGYQAEKDVDDNFNHLDTVHERGGQTNGQPLDDSKDHANG